MTPSLCSLAKKAGMSRKTLSDRVKRMGWTLEKALSEPIRKPAEPPAKGSVFNRLKIIRSAVIVHGGARAMYSKCRCECKTICVVRTRYVVRGLTKSCGCLRSEMAVARNKKRAA